MEDKMIEIKRFTSSSDAEILVSLLKSEGIDCYVRDANTGQIYGGIAFGGAKVELLEKDLPRAQEIMKDFGYLDSENNKEEDNEIANYRRQKEKRSRMLTIFCFLIIVLVVVIIYLNKYFNG